MNRNKNISTSSLESNGGSSSVQPSSGLVTCQVNANDRLFYLMETMVCWPKLSSLFSVDWFPHPSKSDFVSLLTGFFFQAEEIFAGSCTEICRLHQNSSISCILCCAMGEGRSWWWSPPACSGAGAPCLLPAWSQ